MQPVTNIIYITNFPVRRGMVTSAEYEVIYPAHGPLVLLLAITGLVIFGAWLLIVRHKKSN